MEVLSGPRQPPCHRRIAALNREMAASEATGEIIKTRQGSDNIQRQMFIHSRHSPSYYFQFPFPPPSCDIFPASVVDGTAFGGIK